jgi:hypothetical protein
VSGSSARGLTLLLLLLLLLLWCVSIQTKQPGPACPPTHSHPTLPPTTTPHHATGPSWTTRLSSSAAAPPMPTNAVFMRRVALDCLLLGGSARGRGGGLPLLPSSHFCRAEVQPRSFSFCQHPSLISLTNTCYRIKQEEEFAKNECSSGGGGGGSSRGGPAPPGALWRCELDGGALFSTLFMCKYVTFLAALSVPRLVSRLCF